MAKGSHSKAPLKMSLLSKKTAATPKREAKPHARESADEANLKIRQLLNH